MKITNTLTETAREAVEAALGYRFRNRALLTQAFTRASYCNEAKQIGVTLDSNEVLEFFGDSILYAIVADYLFETHITLDGRGMHAEFGEGPLTLAKISLTDKSYLSGRIRALGLDKYLLITTGDRAQAVTDSMAEDLFEALSCAVWVDSGRDFAVTRAAVRRMLDPQSLTLKHDLSGYGRAEDAYRVVPTASKSPKNELQEWCDKRHIAFDYDEAFKVGPDHDPRFSVVLTVVGVAETEGVGRSKREAETKAAEAMLPLLHAYEQNPTPARTAGKSAKSELQEWCDKRKGSCVYDIDKTGPDHAPLFKAQLTVKIGTDDASEEYAFFNCFSRGDSQREAEENAAHLMLARLREYEKSPKGELRRLCTERKLSFCYDEPVLEKLDEYGEPTLTATLTVDGIGTVVGEGETEELAQDSAAEAMCAVLRNYTAVIADCPDTEASAGKSPKNSLQERCDKTGAVCTYEHIGKFGEEHDPIFAVQLTVDGFDGVLGGVLGEGHSKKEAEFAAARTMLLLIRAAELDAVRRADEEERQREKEYEIQRMREAARQADLSERKEKTEKPARMLVKEWCDRNGNAWDYISLTKNGPDNAPTFATVLAITGVGTFGGTGASKKEAQEDAARRAMMLIDMMML